MIKNLAKLKIEAAKRYEKENQMSGLANLVVFEDEISQEDQDMAA